MPAKKLPIPSPAINLGALQDALKLSRTNAKRAGALLAKADEARDRAAQGLKASQEDLAKAAEALRAGTRLVLE